MCCIGRSIGKCYCGFCCLCNYLQSPLLLFFRLVWGWLFFQAGWAKFAVTGIPATADFFASMGIALPLFSAYLVATVEMVGGLLLMVGFLSRLVAVPLIIIMITAYMTAHQQAIATFSTNPHLFLEQPPWDFLVATVLILAFGPGCLSIDRWWQSCCRKKMGCGCGCPCANCKQGRCDCCKDCKCGCKDKDGGVCNCNCPCSLCKEGKCSSCKDCNCGCKDKKNGPSCCSKDPNSQR